MRLASSILALSIAGVAPASAQTAPPQNGITVQGTCTASAAPDRARVTVTVITLDNDAAKATQTAIASYNQFRAAVDRLHLPDAVLNSSGVQVDRRTEDKDGRIVTMGYQVRAGLTVETSDVAGMARLLQAAANDGMNEISPMAVYLSDGLRNKLELACLPKASADARARASALLTGLGLRLGRLQSITELNQPTSRPLGDPISLRSAAAVPDLMAGPQDVTITVGASFAVGSATAPAK